MDKTISIKGRRLLASAAIGGIALFVGAVGLISSPSSAQAASPGCTAAPFHATPEQSIGTAFVDVGAGNKATFVCVTSTAFTGGSSNEVTTNGALANGCYVVQGLGTSVVAVFWEQLSIRPDCVPITGIDVGTSPAATTPTPGAATATPTTAATTATATPRPATATVAASTPTPASAATATPVKPIPTAPNTGDGPGGTTNSSLPGFLTGGLLILAALAFAGFLQHQKR
ncbi:MAG: hypothetical protein ABI939_07290 [Anaerolineaceae bacterium]